MRYYLGIDPGKKGSYSVIDEKGKITILFRMPILQLKKPEIDTSVVIANFRNIQREYGNPYTIIEKAQAMPGQGVTSMFSYGMGYGLLIGILTTLGIPFAEVHPRTWTKDLFKGISGEGKDRCYASARQIFPEWQPKYKYERDWADSLLIAEYGRRLHA